MKKIIALTLAVALSAFAFAGCGSKKEKDLSSAKTITVAATATPHAEMLEQCKDIMAEDGYTLKIKTMSDYVIPNTATESGDVDANFFQHTPYLEEFNQSKNTHLVSVAKIHYEPLGIYAGTSKSLTEIPDGAKIAVPNDTTNEARALLLLDANGLIKLKDSTSITSTKNDIESNPHNYEIVELAADMITKYMNDYAVAVINGNYAMNAGLKVADALAIEDADSTAAQTYANVLVVKKGNEKAPIVEALAKALKSEKVKKFVEEKYQGSVVVVD